MFIASIPGLNERYVIILNDVQMKSFIDKNVTRERKKFVSFLKFKICLLKLKFNSFFLIKMQCQKKNKENEFILMSHFHLRDKADLIFLLNHKKLNCRFKFKTKHFKAKSYFGLLRKII
jgi:hypothetical protein